jgi:uncharacterized protein YecE (DUF72 family)
MTNLLFGTSSWSEKSWIGAFYPENIQPGDMLAFYARHFRTVEADVTYYRIPEKRIVAAWAKKIPDNFKLAAKFPRSIVHGGQEKTPDADSVLVLDRVRPDLDRFLDSMRLLGHKCGPLVLQFPYFNKSVFPSAAIFYERLERFLGELPSDFRYGIEIRNRTWLTKELMSVLREHQTALVLADIPYMPHPGEFSGSLDIVTTDFMYIRLIGDRKAVEEKTEVFNRIVIDQSARLKRWAEFIAQAKGQVQEIFAYANNHFAGFGVGTIRELMELLDELRAEPEGKQSH